MLRIVEAIIGLELCEQSYAERAAQCQEKIHASEAARSAAERARYQGTNYTPHDLSTPPQVKYWKSVLDLTRDSSWLKNDELKSRKLLQEG